MSDTRDSHMFDPNKPHIGFADDMANIARGLLMGAADAIPGVSGGTVALIVGIYSRLVTAISHFDATWVNHLRNRRWHVAAKHVDIRFLVGLGSGIGLGVILLGEVMHHLLSSPPYRELAYAAFFGMILASSWLVAKVIANCKAGRMWKLLPMALLGCAIAYALTGALKLGNQITLPYVFLCGVIGICAMILPGISGAYLMVIFGLYVQLTDIAKSLRHFDLTGHQVAVLLVFVSGASVGIITFSKLLKWLLVRYEAATMALLCGFMLGALRKIWPFQEPVGAISEDFKHQVMRNVVPDLMSGRVMICLGVAVVGFVGVIMLHVVSRRFAATVEHQVADKGAESLSI